MDAGSVWSVMASLVAGVTVLLDFLKSALNSLAWPATVLVAICLFRKQMASLLSNVAAIKAVGFEASFGHQVQTMEPLQESEDNFVEGGEGPAQSEDPSDDDDQLNGGDHTGRMGTPSHPLADDFDFDPSDPDAAILARTKLLIHVKEFAASAWLSSQAKRDFKEARLVAANSASAAVLLAWRAVEGILRDISFYLNVHHAGTSASAPLRQSSRQIMKSLYKRDLIDSDAFDRYFDLVRLRDSVAHAEHFSASTEDVREYIDRAQELGVMLARVLSKIESSTQQEPSPQRDLALFDDQARQD